MTTSRTATLDGRGRRPGRPGRGAAGPGAALQRRRRRDGRRACTAPGLSPESVLVRRSSLEDVFLRLTGRTWWSDHDSSPPPPPHRRCRRHRRRRASSGGRWTSGGCSSAAPGGARGASTVLTPLGCPRGHGPRPRLDRRQRLRCCEPGRGQLPRLHRAGPARRLDHAAGELRVELSRARCDQVGPSSTTRQLATPLRVRDVLTGHLLWVAVRLGISALVFLVVMALFATFHSWWAVLCLPAAVLTGMAFVPRDLRLRRDARDRQRLRADVPVRASCRCSCSPGRSSRCPELPDWLEPVAYAVPLWHGVDLCRDLALGTASLLRVARARGATCCSGWRVRYALALRTSRTRLVDVSAPAVQPSSMAAHAAAAARFVGTGGAPTPRGAQLARLPARVAGAGLRVPRAGASTCSRSASASRSWWATWSLPGGEVVTYTAFVAPAMLAPAPMNGAIIDSTFNVFFKLKYNKLYDAVLATPVTPATSRSVRSPGR